MKKLKTMLALFSFAALLASCGATPTPAEYNNKLMTAMNDNEKHMNALNAAMTNADYAKAEAERKGWAARLDTAISAVEKMPAIKDDGGLKAAVTEGLKGYKQIADADYKKLIDLRSREKSGDTTVTADIQATLDKINTTFESIGGKINKASDEFQKQVKKP